jgi:hypothetical protein
MNTCANCGFKKDRFILCQKCSRPVCYKCINEGLCNDCYIEVNQKIQMIEEEYEREKSKTV